MAPTELRVFVLLLIAALAASCAAAPPPPAPIRIRIATGSKSGIYDPLGRALAKIYNKQIPNVSASAFETTGSLFNIRAIEEGRAELAFSQADVAYLAFQGDAGDMHRYTKLRAMAVLYVNAIQIVTLQSSPLHRLADLAGRRVGVGAHESGTEIVSHLVLQSEGLSSKIRAEPLAFDQLVQALKTQALDAGFIVSSYPVPAVADLSQTAPVRLIPLDVTAANRVRSTYPFLRPITIPKDTYKGQTIDVATMGVDNLLLCSSALPDDLVHELIRIFIESRSILATVHPAAAGIDPEQAPAAPIPVHPGAIRLYRERQLLR